MELQKKISQVTGESTNLRNLTVSLKCFQFKHLKCRFRFQILIVRYAIQLFRQKNVGSNRRVNAT